MGLYGLDAFVVEVEVDLSRGLPAFEMVGLPDAAVREANLLKIPIVAMVRH